MKVILLEDVEGIGKAGVIVEVSDDFARTVLFPKGQAATATDTSPSSAIATHAPQSEDEELSRLQDLVELVDQKTVPLRVPLNPSGTLDHAVTAADITREIERALSVQLPVGAIHLATPITEPGETNIVLHFPHNLEADVIVIIEGAAPTTRT